MRNLLKSAVMAISAASLGLAGCSSGGNGSSTSAVPAAILPATATMSATVRRSSAVSTASTKSRQILTIPVGTTSVEVDAYTGALPLPVGNEDFIPPNNVQPATTSCTNFPVNDTEITVTAQVPIGQATVVISAYSGSCSGNGGPGTTGGGTILSQASGTGTATAQGGDLGVTFFNSQNGVNLGLVPTVSVSGSTATWTPNLSDAMLSTLGLTSNPTISGPSSLASIIPSGLGITYSTTPPGSISTFSLHKGRSKQSATIGGATGLIYAMFTPSSAFTIPASPLTFTYPLAVAPSIGVDYRMAFYNGTTWTADTFDPIGTISGNSLSVTVTPPADLPLTAGTEYGMVLYTVPTSLDTASIASGTINVGTSPSTATATISGAQGSLDLSGADSVGQIAYNVSLAAPVGVTPPTSGVTTIYGYAAIMPASTLVFPQNSTVTASLVTDPNTVTVPGGNYFVAYSPDGVSWTNGIGTSTVNGNTVSITASNTLADMTLTGGRTYYLAVYQ
jgi:hypothetical protein